MIWKTIHWTIHLLFWISVAVLVAKPRNRRSARILSNGAVEFAPTWFSLCAEITFFVLGMSFIAPRYLKQGLEKPWEFAIGAAFCFAVFLSLLEMPGTLLVSSDGLEQVHWLRKNRRIRWKEIIEINTGEKNKSRTVTVTGKNRTKIVHTSHMSDRPRFLFELKRHCGEELPPDFPREPIADGQV